MQRKEVCWNITTRCNQKCKYCHRFLNISELTFEENERILKNLIEDGITDITWTGGEALLYPNIEKLLKISYDYGIKNKLITNGKTFCKENIKMITDYLDSITLSIDSTNEEVNEVLGRGKEHLKKIEFILENLKDSDIKIRINTVANKKNINCFKDLINFLNKYRIYSWRIFRFMPLRETAVKNKDEFEISNEEFDKIKEIIESNTKINKVDFREEKDMEDKYVLLVANGDIIVTENGKDIKKGNGLNDRVSKYM